MIAGRYTLDEQIGRGGMGVVWRGQDTLLGRPVAVKRMGLTPGSDTVDHDRAEREARLAAQLNHPHVVAVYDMVDHDGQQYLVMEHVDGTSLAGLLALRGALDADEAASVASQVAEALATAHEAGIVHRDVKPSNILLTEDGAAKLSDFGIARAQADAALTQTGLVTGSPAYLAPEVATGRPATAASDVWSLGATCFHVVAGRPPYEVKDNVLGAMYRIVHDEPPRLEDGPMAPVVARMMSHDAADRPSMREVVRELAALDRLPVRGADRPDAEAPTQLAPAAALLPVRDPDPAPTEQVAALAPASEHGEPTALWQEDTGRQEAVPHEDGPAPPLGGHRRDDAAPDRRPLLWAAVAVVVIIAFAAAAILGRGDSPVPDDVAGQESTQAPAPADEPEDEPSEPAGPTADDLEAFARDYVQVAATDAPAGFARLTPGYQAESGGLEGYEGFWGSVTNPQIDDVRGDPDDLTVTYDYSYDVEGAERRSETVRLRLEQDGDTFLIAGADSI